MEKKKIGRPTKAEAMARRLANNFAPGGGVSDAYVCLEETYGLTNERGFLAKLDVIDAAVAEALAKASKLAKNSAELTAQKVPWAKPVSPLAMVQRIKQQMWVAQRIAESLEAHLVETSLVLTSLKRRLDIAQAELNADTDRLPKRIETFARRLHHAGLFASPVESLTNEDITSVISILNSRFKTPAGSGSEGMGRPIRRTDKAEAERTRDEADEAVRLYEISRPVIAEVPVDNTIEPPAPEYGAQWLDVQPAPPEFWDSQVETGLPYRWEYREAEESEMNTVMCFPLPERDSWDSFRKHEDIFRENTEDFDFRLANLEEMAVQYIGHTLHMKPTEVPDNWMKAWILLVWARHDPEATAKLLGERLTTYFAGVAIPVPTRGGLAMRELKPI